MKKHGRVVYPEFSVMTAWCQSPGPIWYSSCCVTLPTVMFNSLFTSQQLWFSVHFLKIGLLSLMLSYVADCSTKYF